MSLGRAATGVIRTTIDLDLRAQARDRICPVNPHPASSRTAEIVSADPRVRMGESMRENRRGVFRKNAFTFGAVLLDGGEVSCLVWDATEVDKNAWYASAMAATGGRAERRLPRIRREVKTDTCGYQSSTLVASAVRKTKT